MKRKNGALFAPGNLAPVGFKGLLGARRLGHLAGLHLTLAGMIEAVRCLGNGNGRKRDLGSGIARRTGAAGMNDWSRLAGEVARAGSGDLFGAGEALHD